MKTILKKTVWFTVITTLCLVVVTLFVAVGCEKNEKSEDKNEKSKIEKDYSNIENLYEQPLPIIEQCIKGEWKWMTYISGFAGWIPMDNGIVEITIDKIKSNKGIQEFYWKQQRVESPFGIIQPYVAYEKETNIPICFFERIRNDTMTVAGFMFYPEWHQFIRMKNNNR